VADRGSAFQGDKFKKFLEDQGIQPVLISTAATPQSNGQIERINRSLTPMLAKLVENTHKWDRSSGEVDFAFNNSLNHSTGVTPSRLLYGTNQIGGIKYNLRLFLNNKTKEEISRKSANMQLTRFMRLGNIYKKITIISTINFQRSTK
jgi:transposase InsO family protein